MSALGLHDARLSIPGARVFDVGTDLRQVAGVICDRAWRGLGVRAYRWPDGVVLVVSTDSRGDQLLLRDAQRLLLGTYCRQGALSGGAVGPGPALYDVLDQLQWAVSA